LIALETTFHAQKEDYKSDRGGMLFRGHDTSPFAIECINVAGLKQGAVHQLAALHGVEQPVRQTMKIGKYPAPRYKGCR
jgi:hypothetical protein